ncbi:Ger(x)C family spore germination protein [Sporosarcina sp. BI001-red]|uniref:Ger(x)C family spore germination protein n=1 Tax=Sporosarcina sp. BI001-red TaxID=2282866 RepID=UPI000E24B968|nr:Ger(x)C family spore germination protein [Sporosarcina sp. BI001-red]REB11125.1 Ger(x)C family spore germination protein [Sporosarcina sp. BI001-red]
MKKRIKAGLLLLLVGTFFLPSLSGCAYKGVDKRSFVVGIGVDPAEGNGKDDKFKVTLKIAKPIASLKSNTENEYAYLVHESDSVAEAMRYLDTEADKVLDYSQTKILALNPEILSGDLFQLMDYFVRRGDFQLLLYVVAAVPSAEEVLKVKPKLESAGENSLYNFFDETGTESPFVVTTFLFEFRRDYDTKGLSTVLPIVRGEDSSKFIVNHSIVLKDTVEPVELGLLETKLYNSLKKNSSGFGYQIDNEGYKFTLTLDRINMKIKIQTKDGQKPRAVVRIKAVGAVNESNKLLHLKELGHYDRLSAEKLTEEVKELFESLQSKDVDPFGFGLKYRATRLHTDSLLDEWKAIYPELEFDVKVDLQLKSVGAIQ